MQDTQSHKQAFWFTIINYAGILIGLLSTLFLYPKDYTFYGEIAYIDSLAQVLYPVMIFGGSQALIHFYPTLSHDNKRKLFKYGIKTIGFTFLIITAILLLFEFTVNSKVIKYFYFALPLGLLMAFIDYFKRQSANLQKIVVPTFYDKLFPKIGLPVVFGLFLFGYFTENLGFVFFVGIYFVLLLFLGKYLFKHFSVKSSQGFTSLFDEVSKKEYFQYCFYSFLGSFGSFLAFRVDGLMIPEFLNFEANGAYRNAVNFATAMAIPATGLFTVYAPQISAYIKNNDWETLQMKYVETSKLLFLIGAVILGCVLVGAEPFFKILPTSDKLLPILPVIYILGANVLFNMATGFNSEIISYSKYYKFNIVAVFILVVVNVVLNYVFLTQTDLGIVGVSIATLVSLVLFNLAKLTFIYKKMSIIPFDRNYAILAVLLSIVISLVILLPSFSNVMLEIFVKVSIVILCSLYGTYKLKLVPAFNFWFEKSLKK